MTLSILICVQKTLLTGVGKGVGGDVAIVTIGLPVEGLAVGLPDSTNDDGGDVGGDAGGDVGGDVLGDIVGGFVCPSNVGLLKRKQV